jgi:hypothetical protein
MDAGNGLGPDSGTELFITEATTINIERLKLTRTFGNLFSNDGFSPAVMFITFVETSFVFAQIIWSNSLIPSIPINIPDHGLLRPIASTVMSLLSKIHLGLPMTGDTSEEGVENATTAA